MGIIAALMFLKEIFIAVARITDREIVGKRTNCGYNIDGERFHFDRAFLAFIISEPYD